MSQTSPTASSPAGTSSIGGLIFRFFASFGLATTVLVLLLLVTLLGTLEQLDHGLLRTQVKYFESFFITSVDLKCCLTAMHWPWGAEGVGTMPVILPGGYLLMLVLAMNMICGGLIRLKKEMVWLVKLPLRLFTGKLNEARPVPRRVGVFIAHFSIVFMLLAGVVSLYFKKEGATWVREGETADEFQSFHNSVIEIERVRPQPDGGKREALVIPDTHFRDLAPGKERTFTSSKLPFEIAVTNYFEHCEPRKDDRAGSIDGYRLQEVAAVNPRSGKVLEHESQTNGAYVTIHEKNGGEQRGIIWRTERAPWTFKVGDEEYAISLTRRTYELPFAVTLKKFIRKVHPGTMQAREFSSEVVVTRNGHDENKLITMNQPLRAGGFAFFQSSFDEEAADRGGTQASMFQIASNPSDHWPLWSLIAAGIGLLIQFIWALVRFIDRENKTERSVVSATPAPLPR